MKENGNGIGDRGVANSRPRSSEMSDFTLVANEVNSVHTITDKTIVQEHLDC